MEEVVAYLGDDNTFADADYAGKLADAIQQAGSQERSCRAIAALTTSASTLTFCRNGMTSAFGTWFLESKPSARRSSRLFKQEERIWRPEQAGHRDTAEDWHLRHSAHPDLAEDDSLRISRISLTFIEDNEFEYPVAIPLTPLPGTEDFEEKNKAAGRIITEKLDFYMFDAQCGAAGVDEPPRVRLPLRPIGAPHVVLVEDFSAASAARRRSGRS